MYDWENELKRNDVMRSLGIHARLTRNEIFRFLDTYALREIGKNYAKNVN